jgi:hypothetical protein
MARRATEKQKGFLRGLLRKSGDPPPDWDFLTRRQASRLIEDQLLKQRAQRPGAIAQASLPLPTEEPTTELGEFKRWARGVYQRGEKTIFELIDLQRERFGNPLASPVQSVSKSLF